MSGPLPEKAPARGVVVAGTNSGCGKTTVTLGLMAALMRRGLKVAPFKVGPDFIDPGHHAVVTGRSGRNLDGWMIPKETNLSAFTRNVKDADAAVVEGVMGLFDGYDGRTEAGSTAQMAKWLGLPVLLIVNARSMARSAAALVSGFERFDPDLTFAGVIFNNIGSPRHLKYLTDALEGNVGMPCLGGIPRNPDIAIPERHLGLVIREDHLLLDDDRARLAALVEDHVDLDALLARLPEIPGDDAGEPGGDPVTERVRIGVAKDNAFCFYYPDNLEWLERFGAEIVPFSPVAGDPLPPDLDGLYFGGGYPELHAKKLFENEALRRAVREKSREGMPIYGECGGFMFLCERLVDLDGNDFEMAGCFPFTTRMLKKLRSLGYREASLTEPSLLGAPGLTVRGHEFHYSALDPAENHATRHVYDVARRDGEAVDAQGFMADRTLGSYIHLHFSSRPEAARNFVQTCATYRKERKRTI